MSIALVPALLVATLNPPNVSPPAEPTSLEAYIAGLSASVWWRTLDPTWPVASGFVARKFAFGARTVVRVTPQIVSRLGAVPVYGADRVVAWQSGSQQLIVEAPLAPSGDHVLGGAEAVQRAVDAVPGSLISRTTAAQSGGLASAYWLRFGDGLRAAWRVRLPGLRLEDLRDVWIDAETGRLLGVQPVVRFNSAPAWVFDPTPNETLDNLITGEVDDLLRPTQSGDNLRGWHFETYNCCKRYTCADGAAECDVEQRVCADDDDVTAILSTIDVALPTAAIPFDLGLLGFDGDTIYLRSVFCTEKPRLTATSGGFFPAPIDVTRDEDLEAGLASETDAFVELQTYYMSQRFFSYLREVLDDPAFCLGQASMQCDASGDAVLDANDASQPALAFHISGNLLMPDVLTQQAQIALGLQLAAGQGQTADDPVEILDYQRFGNAAFIPATTTNGLGIPEEYEALAAVFVRPFDSNIYAQGDRDFGYDGDVVAHEFQHAVTYTYVPALGSDGMDRWGAHVEPGALNEGWSDYFSASFTGSSMTGEYAGEGLRDAENQDTCPASYIGEVHQDSLPWSGALWDLRQAVVAALGEAAVPQLDQLLLAALAMSASDETMAQQAARIIELMGDDADLATLLSDAEAAFAAHNVRACERVFPLVALVDGEPVATPKADLLHPGPDVSGLSNYAPGVMQFSIELPVASGGFTLTWTQAAGGFGGGSDDVPLGVLVQDGAPVEWRYESGQAVPYDAEGEVIPFDVDHPVNQAEVTTGGGSYTYNRGATCATRTLYVALVATEQGYNLTDIAAEVLSNAVECDTAPATENSGGKKKTGCAATPPSGLLLLLIGLAWRRRHV